MSESAQRLRAHAQKTLQANLVQSDRGLFLAAGGNQFRTLWVRDFCFSVPGLIAAGFAEVVERQLQLIVSFQREDGALPRGIDVVDPKLRVFLNVVFRLSPQALLGYGGRHLRPEYLGEHGTPAYDSNLLTIRSHFELKSRTSKEALSATQLEKLLDFYQPDDQGLLQQPPYSDWQDSARREGVILHTQLLFLQALRLLGRNSQAKALQGKILSLFLQEETGLFSEQLGTKQVSLETHLLLLNSPLADLGLDQDQLYRRLKAHPLWTQNLIPGIPVYPRHQQVSWSTKIVGLGAYHDQLHWGWLVAEAYKTCLKMQDRKEAERILECYASSALQDPYLAEVYRVKNAKSLERLSQAFYRSEMPFSWTAAKWIEALEPLSDPL